MGYANPKGKIGYNELSPYLQKLLKISAGVNGIYTEKAYQIIDHSTNKVPINIKHFDEDLDELLVFRNGYYLTLGLDYTLDSKYIYCTNDEKWQSTAEDPTVFDYFCIGNAKAQEQNVNFIKVNISMDDSNWVEEDGLYYYIVNHNLGSEYLVLSAINSTTKESLEEVYTVIDKQSIKIYNEYPLNITLTIIDVIGTKTGNGRNNGSGVCLKVKDTDFVYDETIDMYKFVLIHSVGTENIVLGVIDKDKCSTYAVYDIIDNESILLYNTEQEELSIAILPV